MGSMFPLHVTVNHDQFRDSSPDWLSIDNVTLARPYYEGQVLKGWIITPDKPGNVPFINMFILMHGFNAGLVTSDLAVWCGDDMADIKYGDSLYFPLGGDGYIKRYYQKGHLFLDLDWFSE